jgi:uncharacterized protein (DUF1330 family)
MPAYVITTIDVTDPAKYENYKALSPGAIAAHGGKFLVRGGKTSVLEGDWNPTRLVVVQFDSMEKARAFYDSPEYRKAREARKGAANMRMVAVEGA